MSTCLIAHLCHISILHHSNESTPLWHPLTATLAFTSNRPPACGADTPYPTPLPWCEPRHNTRCTAAMASENIYNWIKEDVAVAAKAPMYRSKYRADAPVPASTFRKEKRVVGTFGRIVKDKIDPKSYLKGRERCGRGVQPTSKRACAEVGHTDATSCHRPPSPRSQKVHPQDSVTQGPSAISKGTPSHGCQAREGLCHCKRRGKHSRWCVTTAALLFCLAPHSITPCSQSPLHAQRR